MDAKQYKSERARRGTNAQTLKALGVTYQTIWNRETGRTPITTEAELALLSLPLLSQTSED